MEILLAKIICIFVFILVTAIGCAIPYLLNAYKKNKDCQDENKMNNIISNLNCFGSGFIFSITMFHLLPETIHIVIENSEMKFINSYNSEIKMMYVFFFVFVGFAIQLALEYVLPVDNHICCVRHDNKNSIEGKNYTKNLVKVDSNHHTKDMHTVIINDNQYIDVYEKHNVEKKSCWKFLQVLTMQSFFLTISLAIHSFIEGIVVGISNQINFVFINSFCILAHKWIAGITVSLMLNKNKLNKNLKILLLLIFIFASPMGIVLGYFIQVSGEKKTCIISAFSIGTLLFIGSEILLNEINNQFSRKIRFIKWCYFCFSCIFSFLIICAAAHICPHAH